MLLAVTEDERRVVVDALMQRRVYGSASAERLVADTGLGQVEGYALLAGLERQVLTNAMRTRASSSRSAPGCTRVVKSSLRRRISFFLENATGGEDSSPCPTSYGLTEAAPPRIATCVRSLKAERKCSDQFQTSSLVSEGL